MAKARRNEASERTAETMLPVMINWERLPEGARRVPMFFCNASFRRYSFKRVAIAY
jgi:hypothetical protein